MTEMAYCEHDKEKTIMVYALTGICTTHHLCDHHDCPRKPGNMSDE